MGNLWLKIKIWTKITLAALLAIYLAFFIFKNGGRTATFWWWFYRDYETSLLFLVLIAFVAGSLVTLLLMTVLRTVRQIRELRSRNRAASLEAEIRDMKSKAAMLQTRPSAATTGADRTSPASHSVAGPASLSDVAPAIDDDDDAQIRP